MKTYTVEEQKANRVAWVEALRSGKYQQGRKALRSGDSFCCLGVACDISGLDEWDENGGYFGGGSILPRPVMYWLGLKSQWGSCEALTLTSKNDDGATFAEIADIIESEPAGLVQQ